MSLFTTLYQKKQDRSLENYFTEIVAGLFRRNPQILYQWLVKIGALEHFPTISEPTRIYTQGRYTGSQPDFFVEINEANCKTVILVESKISYKLGPNQLERYAKVLEEHFPHAQKRCLIFISHTYLPVDQIAILKDTSKDLVCFYKANWDDFYHLLTTFPDDTLASETRQFMKERGMAQENQFTLKDLSALISFPKMLNLMEACLSNEVLDAFRKFTGNQRARPKYDADWGAYWVCQDAEAWFLGIGFFFGEQEDEPRLALEFYAKPSVKMPGFILMLKDLLKLDEWEPYDWDGKDDKKIGPEVWPGVSRSVYIKEFVDKEDNISLIKSFLLQRMDEIVFIKKQYPKLPW